MFSYLILLVKIYVTLCGFSWLEGQTHNAKIILIKNRTELLTCGDMR